MQAAVAQFVERIQPGDTAVFVYSGHGWSDGSTNYVVGVDVPDVDTVLLLRPTQSATLFTQQLGRGLRRAVEQLRAMEVNHAYLGVSTGDASNGDVLGTGQVGLAETTA